MGDVKGNGLLALGIHWAHDASVSVCNGEECLFSIAEERITRIKHHYGFPVQSIQCALRFLGLTGSDIDIVAISTRKPLFPQHKNHLCVEADGSVSGPALKLFKDWRPGASKAGPQRMGEAKPKKSFVGTSWEGFEDRHWSWAQQTLGQLGLLGEGTRYVYVSHHRAHAAGAFRLCGMHGRRVCVMTLDGKGDGLSGTLGIGHEDGRLELVRSTPAEESLGSFYQAVTEALGFIPVDGEYKTMGLAALGKAGLANPFDGMISAYDGMTRSRTRWSFRSFNEANPSRRVPNPLSSVAQSVDFTKYLERMEPTQLAYFAQEHLEDTMVELARQSMDITGTRNLAVAGGVMLNVKANSRIRDEISPQSYFVLPDSADSGLSLGAALEALHVCGTPVRASLPSLYLGTSYTDAEVMEELARHDRLAVEEAGPWLPMRTAKELRKGKVIGTFQGRLEMGPRALGNRSVIADPRTNTVKDRINAILKGREWFVPFAPIVLEDEAHKYWSGSVDYRHMTFAVEASEYAKQTVPGVVHVDGTMRPQVVNETTNPWLHAVLSGFRQLTGVGVLINTSFNRHGLPIVGSPADAVEHLLNGWVDALAIGPCYVTLK
ncbi:carbamoyltransferase [Humidesulfovibrio mexicanus]|uniref:Carbamoyltransferase n=1 Tax=Humidesulfovibrio mexicanus TaxID=147047 RepID=A0A238Y8K3_9BACT|nr:carbamoyltransferase [Humidesulfovibrio mexicanus]